MLKKYIKENGGVVVFYRVVKDYEDEFLELQIGEEDEKKNKKLADEIRDAIFKRPPQGVYVFATEQHEYPYKQKTVQQVDFAVLSLDPFKGREKFDRLKRISERYREKYIKFLEKEVRNFLKKIMDRDYILAAIARGDIFVPSRYPTEYSDIDILLIVGFRSGDEEKKKELAKVLSRSPGDLVIMDYYTFDTHVGSYSSSAQTLKKKGHGYTVEFSVISWPDFLQCFDIWKEQGMRLDEYDIETFTNAIVLFEKEEIGQKFLNMFLSLS